MFRRFSVNYALLSIGLDSICLCAALAFATYLRPALGLLPFAAHYPEVIPTPWLVYAVFVFEWIAIALSSSVYDGRKNLREVDEFTRLTLTWLLATVAMAGTLYLSFRLVSRLLFLVFVIGAYLLMLSWRFAARMVFNARRAKQERQRRVLIIGAGPVGRELEKQVRKNPQLALWVIGFLDDNPAARAAQPDILGGVGSAAQVVEQAHVDDVVIALPQRAYKTTNRLVGELHALPVKIWVIPDYFRLALHKAAIEEFAGLPMLDLRAPALNDTQRLFKRAFDLLIAFCSLPFILPLLALIGLLIRLESPGKILFRQTRAGENGKLFEMIKFRTMHANAEELLEWVGTTDAQGRYLHKHPNDPRVTRLGRFLRRTSLDELPQVFNVIKGDMSLVGPRPELPYLVERYEPWQRQRFAVPQGITGWWQIHGRSDKPMHLNTEDDLYYVQNYSLLLDLYILLKTPGIVLRGKGAY
jgi:exopolysaccharide biosynthesis polyprenyl glycosylphosphotransferase